MLFAKILLFSSIYNYHFCCIREFIIHLWSQLFSFEIGSHVSWSHNVAKVDSNSWSDCLYFSSAGITGVQHYSGYIVHLCLWGIRAILAEPRVRKNMYKVHINELLSISYIPRDGLLKVWQKIITSIKTVLYGLYKTISSSWTQRVTTWWLQKSSPGRG